MIFNQYEINASQIATHSLALFALIFGYSVIYIFQRWESEFSENRVARNNSICPSNKQRPDITKFDVAQANILANSERHEAFSTCELIEDVKRQQKNWRENSRLHDMAKPLAYNGIMSVEDAAEELNMDHVYIKFYDFLWGYLFIGPMSYFLWKKGTLILSVRQYLFKKGWLKVEEPDIEALIGKLCLEQSQVIHYFAKTKKGSKHGNIAGFFFPDFPYVDNDCNYRVADLFAVDIDLDTKRFVKAKLDNENLTASETLILLWFNTIAAQHVKLHAMANWGINQHSSLKKSNPFLYQNSVVTVMYNFFGYTTFSNFLEVWEKQGLLSNGWSKNGALVKCFNHGIREGVGQHGNITDLVKYSEFVHFTVKVRSIFINEFAKHKHLFPGIDGEAFFVGTVLHSLDHTLMEWNMTDPLWLDTGDKRFGKMAELGRIVRVGFVEDVPFLYFNKRFSGSKNPFYQSVYEKAAKINKKFADNMDTCIIK